MKNRIMKFLGGILLMGFFMSLLAVEVTGQETGSQRKLAQTGLKFLTVSVDARAAGMADALSAQEVGATALFYNPSSMAWSDETFNVALGQTQWIADVTYNSAAASFRTPMGVFGVSGVMVNYGEFLETIRADTKLGYEDIGTYTPTANAFGVGYARALTNRFAVGGHFKWVSQNLGEATIELDEAGDPVKNEYAKSVLAVDFGVMYNTGFRSLKLAMNARNFSRELTYAEENFELPLTFRIGLSMDLVDMLPMDAGMHSLLFSIDTERPRDYYENVKVGMEYTLMNMFSVRAGYIGPTDEQGVSAGIGLRNVAGFDIDYSYSDFGVFDAVNRFTIKFGL